MKALAVTKNSDPFEIIDIEDPDIKNKNDIKIKIHGTGICGGEVHWYNNPPEDLGSFPKIIGHEYSGTIVEKGSNVKNLDIGDKVIAESSKGCEECIYCRTGYTNICPNRDSISGSFTDYIVVPERYVYKLPENVSLDLATLSEPLVCVINGFEKTNITHGDVVVVIGPGPLGLISAFLAKLNGARVIMVGRSSSSERLKIAEELSIPHVINSDNTDIKQYVENLDSFGADVVIGAAGSEEVVNTGFELLKKGGAYTELGLFHKERLNINFEAIVRKEIDVVGAVSHKPESWNTLLKLYKSNVLKDLEKIITGKYKLSNWEEAFENLINRKDAKAIIHTKN